MELGLLKKKNLDLEDYVKKEGAKIIFKIKSDKIEDST